jgi:hypothetical protein
LKLSAAGAWCCFVPGDLLRMRPSQANSQSYSTMETLVTRAIRKKARRPDFFCEQCVAGHSQQAHFDAKRDLRVAASFMG